MYSTPWRGSAQIAVRAIQYADSWLRGARATSGPVDPDAASRSRIFAYAGSGAKAWLGSGGCSCGRSPGAAHGNESSGSRKPMGESPGSR